MGIKERMSGNEAVAYAIKQVNPDVMPAFPITPSTEIPQMVSTYIANGEIDLMINTPFGHETRGDGYELRLAAVRHGVPYATTLSGAQALAQAMEVVRATGLNIVALQDFDQWA